MAITYVQSGHAEGSGVISLSVTLDPTGAGNLLVVCVGYTTGAGSISTIYDTKGDTFSVNKVIRKGGPGTYNSGSYAFHVAADNTQVTVDFTGGVNAVLVVAEYGGTGTSDPFQTSASSGVSVGTGSSIPISAGNLTDNNSGSLFCGFASNAGAGALTITSDAGWNDRQNSGGAAQPYDYLDAIGSGTHNPGWTVNQANTYFAPIGMVFNPIPPFLDDETGIEFDAVRYW